MTTMIDVEFDPRTDMVGAGRDPDACSPGLARLHQRVWSRRLPDGNVLALTVNRRPPFVLTYESPGGEPHTLTSDTVLPAYLRVPRVQEFLGDVDARHIADMDTITRRIGGTILWPGNRIDGRQTINQARGCHPRIRDRFDLTIECVRRHYAGEAHPLERVFDRYRTFFELFVDFECYVGFWLLQDLVDPDGRVREFHPSANFTASPIPATADAYTRFAERTLEFVRSRNTRIRSSIAAADGSGADPAISDDRPPV